MKHKAILPRSPWEQGLDYLFLRGRFPHGGCIEKGIHESGAKKSYYSGLIVDMSVRFGPVLGDAQEGVSVVSGSPCPWSTNFSSNSFLSKIRSSLKNRSSFLCVCTTAVMTLCDRNTDCFSRVDRTGYSGQYEI